MSEWFSAFSNAYSGGEKIFFFSNHKGILHAVVRMLIEDINDKCEMHMRAKKEECYQCGVRYDWQYDVQVRRYQQLINGILVIDGDVTHEMKEKMSSCNTEWVSHPLVCVSPTVGAGIDFTCEHFDKAFGFCSPHSVPARGLNQMRGRVRKLRARECHVYIDETDEFAVRILKNVEASYSNPLFNIPDATADLNAGIDETGVAPDEGGNVVDLRRNSSSSSSASNSASSVAGLSTTTDDSSVMSDVDDDGPGDQENPRRRRTEAISLALEGRSKPMDVEGIIREKLEGRQIIAEDLYNDGLTTGVMMMSIPVGTRALATVLAHNEVEARRSAKCLRSAIYRILFAGNPNANITISLEHDPDDHILFLIRLRGVMLNLHNGKVEAKVNSLTKPGSRPDGPVQMAVETSAVLENGKISDPRVGGDANPRVVAAARDFRELVNVLGLDVDGVMPLNYARGLSKHLESGPIKKAVNLVLDGVLTPELLGRYTAIENPNQVVSIENYTGQVTENHATTHDVRAGPGLRRVWLNHLMYLCGYPVRPPGVYNAELDARVPANHNGRKFNVPYVSGQAHDFLARSRLNEAVAQDWLKAHLDTFESLFGNRSGELLRKIFSEGAGAAERPEGAKLLPGVKKLTSAMMGRWYGLTMRGCSSSRKRKRGDVDDDANSGRPAAAAVDSSIEKLDGRGRVSVGVVQPVAGNDDFSLPPVECSIRNSPFCVGRRRHAGEEAGGGCRNLWDALPGDVVLQLSFAHAYALRKSVDGGKTNSYRELWTDIFNSVDDIFTRMGIVPVFRRYCLAGETKSPACLEQQERLAQARAEAQRFGPEYSRVRLRTLELRMTRENNERAAALDSKKSPEQQGNERSLSMAYASLKPKQAARVKAGIARLDGAIETRFLGNRTGIDIIRAINRLDHVTILGANVDAMKKAMSQHVITEQDKRAQARREGELGGET